MPKKTLTDLRERVLNAIERQEEITAEVAGEHAQIRGNVAHMTWFKQAVACEMTKTMKCWEHLAAQAPTMSF